MRIFQVINVRWFNATAWYAVHLSRLLTEAGHEVLVLGQPDTAPISTAKEWNLPVATMDFNSSNPVTQLGLLFGIASLLKAHRPHIVNCHRGEAFIHWGLLQKKYNFSLVRTRGDQRPPKNNLPNRWLHRKVADAVVATNSRMAGHFTDSLGVPENKVHTIMGGVDRDIFRFDAAGRERIRSEFGLTDSHFVIGLLGRFDRVKGQRELLQAVRRLVHEHGLEHVRLLLIGFDSATPESKVRSWIADSGLSGHVTITGRRSDVPACISALDLGVIASLWSETIARAALEIMSCNVPLVSTDVGVMPDLLEPDALVPAGDVDGLADKLAALAASPGQRDQLRTHQETIIAGLSDEVFLQQTLDLYGSLLLREAPDG